MGLNDASMFLKDCKFNYYKVSDLKESKPTFEDHFIARLDGCTRMIPSTDEAVRFIFGNYSFGVGIIIEPGIIFVCVLRRDGVHWDDIMSDRMIDLTNKVTGYSIRYAAESVRHKTRMAFIKDLFGTH